MSELINFLGMAFSMSRSYYTEHVEGHDNAYVRESAGTAIAEAVDQYPQSLHTALTTVKDYYRENAKVLAPEFDQYVRKSVQLHYLMFN